MAADRGSNGKFVKFEDVVPIRAERSVASDAVGKKMLDKVGNTEAEIVFKKIYHKVGSDFTEVPNKVLMVSRFRTSGSDEVSEKETVLASKYAFVPNNTLLDVAENLGGAEITTDHFGMYFFGKAIKDGLTVCISNSYGGVRSFNCAPTVKIQNKMVPVFLGLKQVHTGNLEAFEFRLRESLLVAKSLQSGQKAIEEVLCEPMTAKDEEFLDKLFIESRLPKKMLEDLIERRKATGLAEVTKPIKSFADAIVAVVEGVKTYSNAKKFSAGLQLVGEKIVTEVIFRSKASALILEAVGMAERELAASGAEMMQSTLGAVQKKIRRM